MKGSRFLISIILVLLGLLILLGSLQYVWLGEIGENQRENMQNRLNRDVRDFAAAFNTEIRWAYFSFQIDPTDWLKRDWTVFNERYTDWKSKANYPDLVKDIYFVGKDSAPIRYKASLQTFEEIQPNDELKNIQNLIQTNRDATAFDGFVVDTYLLVTPIFAVNEEFSKNKTEDDSPKANLAGYSVIKLDEKVVKQFLSDLSRKFFPEDKFANYAVTVSDNFGLKPIFADENLPNLEWEKYDANISILSLIRAQSIIAVFAESASEKEKPRKNQEKIFRSVEVSPPTPLETDKNNTAKLFRYDEQNPKTKEIPAAGNWMLSVRHIDGSLDNFVTNTRRKNLGISFGVLGILAVSLGLIFISVRRAQNLAKRQIEFVSSVSHEFRTPLAVIYSAGENLADGVTLEQAKVRNYGELIKKEGRKLTGMVEQILGYAGANSKRGNYNFVKVNIAEIIEDALNECNNLIEEKSFSVEKSVPENLPEIYADKNALSRALQNLISNSIKYDDGEKFLKISVRNGNGNIKLTVEDKGIGISKKDLKTIFEPFYRAQNVVDAQISGNGLGLSILKQTVEAHGGNVRAESEVGKGSKFTLVLPLKTNRIENLGE